MKNVLAIVFALFSISSFAACTNALPTNNPGFCASFKVAATCYCVAKGLPAGMCQDMKVLYNRMVGTFGTLDRACAYQNNTSKQECIDDWNCYLGGKTDSQGRACSGTGLACS